MAKGRKLKIGDEFKVAAGLGIGVAAGNFARNTVAGMLNADNTTIMGKVKGAAPGIALIIIGGMIAKKGKGMAKGIGGGIMASGFIGVVKPFLPSGLQTKIGDLDGDYISDEMIAGGDYIAEVALNGFPDALNGPELNGGYDDYSNSMSGQLSSPVLS